MCTFKGSEPASGWPSSWGGREREEGGGGFGSGLESLIA